jgi:class 3 adenylate cyclase
MVPDGVRVFLFTDIEGSTRRWERGDIAMPEALAQHDAILAGAITAAGGEVFKHLGDGMAATFPSVAGTAQAAVSAQVALCAAEWPPDADLRVRWASMPVTPPNVTTTTSGPPSTGPPG